MIIGTWGCVSTGAYNASVTRIGIKIGTPEVEILMMGYENIDSTAISDQSSADISTFTRAGKEGLDTIKRTVINNKDIKINESRD